MHIHQELLGDHVTVPKVKNKASIINTAKRKIKSNSITLLQIEENMKCRSNLTLNYNKLRKTRKPNETDRRVNGSGVSRKGAPGELLVGDEEETKKK